MSLTTCPRSLTSRYKSANGSVAILALIGTLLNVNQVAAQSTDRPPHTSGADQTKSSGQDKSGIEILSDTRGVDFGPYIKDMLTMIKKSWLTYIPVEGRPPTNMQAETIIRFTIDADGKLTSMRLEASDHKDSFNRAAWGAITSAGKYPPLPAEFTGPNLEVRIHFLVNKAPATSPQPAQ